MKTYTLLSLLAVNIFLLFQVVAALLGKAEPVYLTAGWRCKEKSSFLWPRHIVMAMYVLL